MVNVKLKVIEHPLGEPVPGISYKDYDFEIHHDITGYQVISYEKIPKIPDGYYEFTEETPTHEIYDKYGVNTFCSILGTVAKDHVKKHSVSAECVFEKDDECHIEGEPFDLYYSMTEDQYSKFVYLFKEMNTAYILHW